MDIKLRHSTVFTKTLNSNKRIIVHEGSARSTKTISIIQYLINRALNSKIKITGGRAKLTWAKATMIPDFLEVITNHYGIFNPNRWNKSESIYYFDNGSEISFVGMDEAQKFHGRKQDIFWGNEAVEIQQADLRQILLRTTGQVILDYNPSYEEHYIYNTIIPRPDCDFFKSTYKDNKFLEQAIIDEIEAMEPTEENIKKGTADKVNWLVYGKGERASHKGLIFSDMNIVDSIPPSEEWKQDVYGLDFGFSSDPTALVHVVYAKGELWLDEIIYKRGLTNIINPNKSEQDSIEAHLIQNEVSKKKVIWADSAEPKSIQDLYNCGYYIKAVEKGPDSIRNGISTMKRFKLNVTSRSINLIKEKNNYKWREDRDGTQTNEPIDMWNHAIDSCRYAIFMEFRNHGELNSVINPFEKKAQLGLVRKKDAAKNESYFK